MSTPDPAGLATEPSSLPWDEDALQLPVSHGDPVTLRFSLAAILAYEKDQGSILGLGFSTSLTHALGFLRAFARDDGGAPACPDDASAFAVYRRVGHPTIAKAMRSVQDKMMEAGQLTPTQEDAEENESPPD
ncbi:MAG: hypothetical protein AAF170_15775 [Bacteroidota bacterium]